LYFIADKSTTIDEVKTHIHKLTFLLYELDSRLKRLKRVKGTDSETHFIALRISILIGDILTALDRTEHLHPDTIVILKPLVHKVGSAMQKVLDAAGVTVIGLDSKLVSLLKLYTGRLFKLGLSLHVGRTHL
jgi:hypothetical protein